MPKEVTKEESRPSVFINDKAKKDKFKQDVKKLLDADMKEAYDVSPELALLVAILKELQK
jgi:poly-D-alanine transfer protein DltD